MALVDIRNQYVNRDESHTAMAREDFNQMAQKTQRAVLSQGPSAAFWLGATSLFRRDVNNLFAQSKSQERAHPSNQLVTALGLGALTWNAGSIPGRVVAKSRHGAEPTWVAEFRAAHRSNNDVTSIAAHEQSLNGSVADTSSASYVHHSTLVKSVGASRLTIDPGHMRRR